MKNRKTKSILAALLAVATPFAVPSVSRAADHGDAPSLAHDQACDIADVFFFLDPNNNDNAILIATIRGFIVPGEAVNFAIFDPVVRYRFEIENTGDNRADKFIDVTFNQRVADLTQPNSAVLQVPRAQTATVKFPRLRGTAGGTFTAPVLNPSLAATANTPTATTLGDTDIQFFAGEVDDPFFFDIPGFSRFIASVRNGAPDPSVLQRGRDSFGGYNILAIAFSIPRALLRTTAEETVGVRFLAQRRNLETPTSSGTTFARGAFKTVDSMGNPAVNVALIPFNRKNAYNALVPSSPRAAGFASNIVATLTTLGTPPANIAALAGVAVTFGDYLRLNTETANTPADTIGGGAPNQGSGFPNGRRLRDDTVDILLNIITNGGITTGDNTNASISQFPQTGTFPFLAPAQQPFVSTDPLNPTTTDDRTQN